MALLVKDGVNHDNNSWRGDYNVNRGEAGADNVDEVSHSSLLLHLYIRQQGSKVTKNSKNNLKNNLQNIWPFPESLRYL